jgi:hypothetical protein
MSSPDARPQSYTLATSLREAQSANILEQNKNILAILKCSCIVPFIGTESDQGQSMNDMSGNFADATPIRHFAAPARAPRLAAPRAFSEASALVEEALGQLRAAENALERQLGDLRAYMNKSSIATS